MKEGSRREAAAGRLTQFTQICHFRSTVKCLPANCLSGDPSLEKWYKSSLCLLQKSTWAFTVLPSLWFTGQAGLRGYFRRTCVTKLRQKSPMSQVYNLLQRCCNPLHWKMLGTCILKKTASHLFRCFVQHDVYTRLFPVTFDLILGITSGD